MPNEQYHRYQQDPARLWQAADAVDGNPPQPRYRKPRTIGGGALSWAGLNKLPAGSFSRHRPNTR
ncbi:DNA repair protein [Micromonospora sp. NPDC048839]|uniref:DNA repair protein n=1 Tax=Micromonospora sp. NPDC048839 TaxID=3155641 RepID=UPI0033E2E0D4